MRAGSRAVIVAAALAVVAAACSDDDTATTAPPSTPTTSPAPTTTTTQPAVDGISATIEQGRPFIARDLLEILLWNRSATDLHLEALRIVDPRFEPVEPTLRDVLLPAGQGPRSMPVTYGAPRCGGDGDAAAAADTAPMVELSRTDGSVLVVPVDASGDDFLGQLHAIKCTRAGIAEVVTLTWGPPFEVIDDAVVEITLHLQRNGRPDEVAIEDISGSVIFAFDPVDELPVRFGADDTEASITVEVSAERCDAHALIDSNKTFRFRVWVGLNGEPPEVVEVVAEGDTRAHLAAAMQAGCAGTLD